MWELCFIYHKNIAFGDHCLHQFERFMVDFKIDKANAMPFLHSPMDIDPDNFGDFDGGFGEIPKDYLIANKFNICYKLHISQCNLATNVCQFPGCNTINILIYNSSESDFLTCHECKTSQPTFVEDDNLDMNGNSSQIQEAFTPKNWLHFLDTSSFDLYEPDTEVDKIIQNHLMH